MPRGLHRIAITVVLLLSILAACSPSQPCDMSSVYGEIANERRAQYLKGVIANDPSDAGARLELAAIYLRELIFTDSIAELVSLTQQASVDPRSFQLLWLAYTKQPQPDYEKARMTLEAGLRALPGQFDLMALLALHYCKFGRKLDCITASRNALPHALNRRDQATLYLLLATAETENSDEHYGRAVALDPSVASATETDIAPRVYIGEIPVFHFKSHPETCARIRRLQQQLG